MPIMGTHLVYVVVVYHMDNAGLMEDAIFFFFCYMMDDSDFYPLQLQYLYTHTHTH